jgi:sulfofructose kinase
MTGTVLCVGALSLDTIFRFDELPDRPGKFLPEVTHQVVQGMATAQAATIVRLGGKARLWATCGDDATGDRMVRDLADTGIDLSALRRLKGAQSGFSSILMDRQGERIIVPSYDPKIATPPETSVPMDDVSVVSVDVRWPDAAAAALRAARERGIPGVLDVERMRYEALITLLPLASHIIASEEGVRQVMANTHAPAEAIAALQGLSQGNAFVAATYGERGVYWSGGHIPAYPVNAIDTLAAGDVFHGSFAFGLSEGWDVERSLRFASAAAAIKCTRLGGRLGAPTRAEVEALL